MKKENVISLIATGVIFSTALVLSLNGDSSDKDVSPTDDKRELKEVEYFIDDSDLHRDVVLDEQRAIKKYIDYSNYIKYLEWQKQLQAQEEERQRLAKIEAENKVKEQQKQNNSGTNLGTFNVSWYTAKCKGCSGITSTNVDVRNTITHQGYRVAASDWSVIPAYSIIEVEGYGKFIVLDRGGAIKGKKLDLLVATKDEAYKNGRQNLKVKLIRKGKGE